MPNTANAPHTVDSLLRVVQARDAEVALLKLLVDKLKVQLLRQARARFGASSEQLDAPQIVLIADLPMHELAPVTQAPKAPTCRQYLIELHGVRDMDAFTSAFNTGLINAV